MALGRSVDWLVKALAAAGGQPAHWRVGGEVSWDLVRTASAYRAALAAG